MGTFAQLARIWPNVCSIAVARRRRRACRTHAVCATKTSKTRATACFIRVASAFSSRNFHDKAPALRNGPKALHWAIVALLVVQYSIGWLMPDVHGGPPGVPMIWHISIGMVILALIVARFLWCLTHPIASESSASAMAADHVRRLCTLAALSAWCC